MTIQKDITIARRAARVARELQASAAYWRKVAGSARRSGNPYLARSADAAERSCAREAARWRRLAEGRS